MIDTRHCMKKIKINKGYGRNRYQNKTVEKNKR